MTVSADDPLALEPDRAELLEQVGDLRPKLHGYCTRLLGSPLEGEDAVQDAFFMALRKRPSVASREELGRWLFRVAHNRCIDLLRRRQTRERFADLASQGLDGPPSEPKDAALDKESVDQAFHQVLGLLPPKERAAVLLKDVLDFSLRETAEIIDSTEAGVKAALRRGRGKLASARTEGLRDVPVRLVPMAAGNEHERLLREYAGLFNSRDWDGLRSLVRADARLQVFEYFDGGLEGFERHYFKNYSILCGNAELRARVGEVAGQAVILLDRRSDARPEDDPWGLYSVVRVLFENGGIVRVSDYVHVPAYFHQHVSDLLGSGPPASFEPYHLLGRADRGGGPASARSGAG